MPCQTQLPKVALDSTSSSKLSSFDKKLYCTTSLRHTTGPAACGTLPTSLDAKHPSVYSLRPEFALCLFWLCLLLGFLSRYCFNATDNSVNDIGCFVVCCTIRFGLKTTFIDEGTFKARVLADEEEFPVPDAIDFSSIPVPVSQSVNYSTL